MYCGLSEVRKHISGVCRIADSRVLEHWRVVDAVPFHRDRKMSRIGRDGVNAPRNGNQFGLTRHSRAGTAGRENGVSHATVATIEHDVFNDADFFALRSLYFCADDLARLHVARATRTRRGLGLCNGWQRPRNRSYK